MNKVLLEDQKFDAMVRSRTPAGRWGQPSDLAGAAIFLASRASDYITGQIIYVEGASSQRFNFLKGDRLLFQSLLFPLGKNEEKSSLSPFGLFFFID